MLDDSLSLRLQRDHKALVAAILEGDLEQIRSLLATKSSTNNDGMGDGVKPYCALLLLEMTDWHGNTPLHIACQDDVDPSVIQFLLDVQQHEHECWNQVNHSLREPQQQQLLPLLLGKRDGLKRTPLHAAISSHARRETIEILFRAFPQAIGMPDFADATPLALALCVGLDSGLIKSMIQCNHGQAVRFVSGVDNNQHTLLHEACQHDHHDLSVYRDIVHAWPTACLLLDEYGKSPYDDALHKLNATAPPIVEYMDQVTREAACALMEVVLSCPVCPSFDSDIFAHVQDVLQDLIPPPNEPVNRPHAARPVVTNPHVLVQTARPYMSQMHLRKLLEWDSLQTLLLHQESCPQYHDDDDDDDNDDSPVCDSGTLLDECVTYVYHMNVAGRRYLLDDPGNQHKIVAVLEAVRNTTAGLFWHVRENPTLVSFMVRNDDHD